MPIPSYPLSIEQLGLLAEKTLVNARELLDEAKALGLLEHYPRALSLGILAAEEFGKHIMCFGAIGLRADAEEMWKGFHERFRSHAPKYENLFAMAASFLPREIAEDYMREMSKHVRVDQDRKLAGLYVDLVEGEAVHPAEVIGPEVVADALVVFDTVISAWEALWEDTHFDELFAEGVERGAEELRYALENDDEEAIARFFRHESDEDESSDR